jgi:hypothetical protein
MHEEPNPTTVTESSKRRHWGTIVLWVAPLAVALLRLGYGFLTRPPEPNLQRQKMPPTT